MFSSVIISTYNNPRALRLLLTALCHQNIQKFEAVIADDGSDEETKRVISELQSTVHYPIKHVWHPHNGFRAAMIRNKAVIESQGEYLIFLDGDCIPNVSLVKNHQKLAKEGCFVAGNRVLLSRKFTDEVMREQPAIYAWGCWHWMRVFCLGMINRLLPVLPLGIFYPRYLRAMMWQGAKTCNLGLWRKDFFAINGFDESYNGWGYEDSDLIIRLIRNHVLRKDGNFIIPVFHLWHQNNSRENEPANYQKLKELEKSSQIRAKLGIDRY